MELTFKRVWDARRVSDRVLAKERQVLNLLLGHRNNDHRIEQSQDFDMADTATGLPRDFHALKRHAV